MKVEIQAPYLSDGYSFFSGPVSQNLGRKSPSVLHSVVLLSVIEKKRTNPTHYHSWIMTSSLSAPLEE